MAGFRKVLVANRGEIACRIIRSAKDKGYLTVAVYSVPDTDARHVRLADEAVLIGEGPPLRSYLDIDRIIAAARTSGADAVHPGYGFLSERTAFAEACEKAGLVFVGPTAEAIRKMGDKAESKQLMIAAGVRCVPGYQGEDQSDDLLAGEAEKIGYPLMVKASAGGGGRGMRLVHEPADLSAALVSARSEALNAFGDARLLLERAIIEPRHVEIQVFGDAYGNVIHLGERDCSVQRRHQKVVEEAPSPAVDAALRKEMGAAAVRAASSIGYIGAGTVEFLLGEDKAFYFLEMNTRLQVEHPVTEYVTGLDLVALQLDVAAGKPLPLTQDDVQLMGHAIEVRLYAEDARNQFLPQTGRVELWDPADREGVRIDHGIDTGATISPYYDPMIAKIISHGADREEARLRLVRAVQDTAILGVTTNKEFLASALQAPEFAQGAATTGFIARCFPDGLDKRPDPPIHVLALAAALLMDDRASRWRSNRWSAHPFVFVQDETRVSAVVTSEEDGLCVEARGEPCRIRLLERFADRVRYAIAGHIRTARYAKIRDEVHIDADGSVFHLQDVTHAPTLSADASGGGIARAPMSGTIVAVHVSPGDAVRRGQLIAVLESMKMEHHVIALIDGTVETVGARSGAQVSVRDILATIVPAAPR